MKLYETVAERVEKLIAGGTLAVGARIPSVRAMSRQQEVSIATVTAAYRLLERRGLIVARPQSGYYVRERCCHRLEAVGASNPSRRPALPQAWDVARQLAEEANRRDLVPFGNADPPAALLPAAALQRRLRGLGTEALRAISYGDPRGELELRTQIARRLVARGCALRADDLLITNGAFEATHLALRATCRPGDAVAIESPVHFILLRMLSQLGLKVVELPTSPRTGLELDALAPLLAEGAVAAVLCQPAFHNPLGARMPVDSLRRLVSLCATHRVPLIEDDVYGELYYGRERPVVAKAFDTDGNVLHASSFSKTLCPGYRIGWLTPGRFEEEIRREKFAMNFVTATPMQLALGAFLRDGSYTRHIRKAARTYADNLLRLREALALGFPPGTKSAEPTGGFVLWVGLPGEVDAMQVYTRALDAGISIVPGHLFSAQDRYTSCIRIAYGHPWDEEKSAAIARLGQIVAALADGS